MSKQDPKDLILQAALKDVPFDGWTEDMLARAAKKSKVSDEACKKLFPRGVFDLILHLSAWADAQTAQKLKKTDIEALRVRDRVTLGVRTRLEILSPHRESVRSATSYMTRPLRQPKMAKALWQSADVIWNCAGDTATDYNRYTKRILLSGVITATTLYWLQDTSKGQQDSWAFLDRRIENVMQLGKKLSSFKKDKPRAA